MKYIKKLLIAICVLFVILLVGGLMLPMFIDVNNYKDKIEQLAEDSMGRKLTLHGDLELKTFPNLRVKTGALSIANPDGFPHANMLEISSAEIGIRVLPLILKKVEAGTIKFDTPVINLTKKSTGEANWEFETNQDEQEKSDSDSSSSALATIAVQGFEISNAKLNYADLSTDTIFNIENLNLNTGSIIPGTSFPIEIDTQLSGSMLADPIQANFLSQASIDGGLENIELNELTSTITQADSDYEITVPMIRVSLSDNQLTVSGLTLNHAIDDQNQAEVIVEDIGLDLNDTSALLSDTKLKFNSADLTANVDLPKLTFDATNQIANINSAVINVNNPDMTATFNLPETDIELNKSDINLNGLGGQFQYKNLMGTLSLPTISFNKDEMSLNASGVQTKVADSIVTTDVTAQLSPLAVNFSTNSEKLNLRHVLAAVETDIQTASSSALTALGFNLSGNYTENGVNIEDLSGKLDNTKFNGNALIKDFSNPVYKLNLNLGDIEIDDYLPKTEDQSTNTAGESAAVVAGTPIALSQFKITAEINANRIHSKANNVGLENMQLGIKPENDNSSISFNSLISGESLPETINVKLNTLAKIDDQKNTAQLSQLKFSASGKTINAGINVPQATIPFEADTISLEKISANFSNEVAKSDLIIPSLKFNSADSSVIIKNVTGKGTFNEMNANIILPNLSVALENQSLKVNELSLDLSGTKPIGRLSIPTLEVNLANQSIGSTNILFEGQDGRAELNLKPSDGKNNYAGNLLASDFNLRGILNRLNVLTDLDDKTALTRVNIQSPISFSQSKLKLENIKANVDQTSINGFVDANLGLNPVYNFSINVGQLNADRYIPAAKEGNSTGSTKAVAAPVAIPVELFKNTRADGKIHFDKLEIGGAQFTNFNIGVASKDGRLSISPIESGFFDGQMNGNLAIDSATSSPRLDFDYALSKVALEPALRSLGVTDKLAGNGNFSLTMGAAGKTDRDMLASVLGNANLAVNNGAIKGVNIQDVLFKAYEAYSVLKDKTANEKYKPTDQTEFSSMTGNWSINKGIISGEDLLIQAPLFRINGVGKISLIDNTIDYLLNVKVVKSLEGQGGKSMKELEGRTIPVSVTGSLNDPQFRPDVSQLVKAEVQRKAEEEIQEKIEEELGEKLEGEGTLKEKLQKKAVEKVGEKLLDLFN